ncbi:MAG: hypothetical protein ACKO0V_09290, partial [bacterium]
LESEEEIQPLKPNQPDNARINLGNDLPEARAAMVQPSLPWLAQNAGLAYLIFAIGMVGSFIAGYMVGAAGK